MRIATFNLENLDDSDRAARSIDDRLTILRPQLERMRADIICLQEVNAQRPGYKRGAPRTFRALDRLLEGSSYETYQRASSSRADGGGPLDVHNLVVLSRPPVDDTRQVWHDLVPPPRYRPVTAVPASDAEQPIRWDRPALHVRLSLGADRSLHVINTHLRAPRAAFIAGQKEDASTWTSVSGWAEGFFLATAKRAGQAFEIRLAVDAIFDADPDASVVAEFTID